ncbi:MAG TPA: AsmA family protein [Candidatus Desulfovibrio intestinavium]|uniref:AsmA family protein n=1 Tax=Candidatus Desulfovibrio intestinavium TaxID=2838534 RepID=A0A9D2KSV1_9BACT|nr:AsmA family protein [Candidatus Desulfovibrio intestinavium]
MKRLLLWSALVILLLGAAGAFILSRVDTDLVTSLVSDAVESATGAPLEFAEAPRLSFVPLGVRFGALSWKREDAAHSLAVSASGGRARLALAPLLSGDIVIEEVELNAPALDMVQHAAPTADTPAAAPAVAERDTASVSSDAAAAAPPDDLPLELGRVQVKDARIRFTDAAGNRAEIGPLQLTLTNVRRHADMTLETGFDYALHQGGKDITGSFALKGIFHYYAPNLTIKGLQAQLAPRSGPIPAGLGAIALQADSAVNLADGKLKLSGLALSCATSRLELAGEASLRELTFAGTLSLITAPRATAALWGLTLPAQGEDRLELSTGLEYSPEGLALRQLKISQDKTHLEGTLSLNPQQPALRGELRVNELRVDQYLPQPSGKADSKAPVETNAASDKTNAAPAAAKADQKAAAPAQPKVWPLLDMALAVGSLRYGEMGVKDLSLSLQGDKGNYQLRDFRCALLSGGRLQAHGSTRLPDSRHALNLTAQGVDLGGLTQMLGKGRPVEGTADATADVTARGMTAEAVQASLNGKGTLQAGNIRIQALSAVLRDVPGLGEAVPERIDRVQVPFVIKNGEVTSRPFAATSAKLNAKGQAAASLPRKHLHATADVNTLGMTVPVIVQGPFSNLSYSVDPRFLARMAAGLPDALLEGGESAGKSAGEAAKGAGNALGNTVRGAGGLVKGLLGR